MLKSEDRDRERRNEKAATGRSERERTNDAAVFDPNARSQPRGRTRDSPRSYVYSKQLTNGFYCTVTIDNNENTIE